MRHGNESGRGGRRARGVAPALLLALTLLAAAVGPATRPAAAAPALRLDAAASFGGNYQPGSGRRSWCDWPTTGPA